MVGEKVWWAGRRTKKRKRKRDFIPPNARDGAEVSLRKPTLSQERKRKKKRRLAPFEMTGWGFWFVPNDEIGGRHSIESPLRGSG